MFKTVKPVTKDAAGHLNDRQLRADQPRESLRVLSPCWASPSSNGEPRKYAGTFEQRQIRGRARPVVDDVGMSVRSSSRRSSASTSSCDRRPTDGSLWTSRSRPFSWLERHPALRWFEPQRHPRVPAGAHVLRRVHLDADRLRNRVENATSSSGCPRGADDYVTKPCSMPEVITGPALMRRTRGTHRLQRNGVRRVRRPSG